MTKIFLEVIQKQTKRKTRNIHVPEILHGCLHPVYTVGNLNPITGDTCLMI